jgi:hypothetical protein
MPPYKPYTSDAQRRWAHTPTGRAALGQADVEGKDALSKDKELPERVASKKRRIKKAIYTKTLGR